MTNKKSNNTIQRVLALKKRLYGVEMKGGNDSAPKLSYNDYSATDFSREVNDSRMLSYKGGRTKSHRKKSSKKELSRKLRLGRHTRRCRCRSRQQTRRRNTGQRGGNMIDLLRNGVVNVSANPIGGVYTSNGTLIGDTGRMTGNQLVDPSPYNQPINNFSKV
jgi:hypothetical protein